MLYIVVACGECAKFQVQQELNESNSSAYYERRIAYKVWAKSFKAKDVRPVCQSLNMKGCQAG